MLYLRAFKAPEFEEAPAAAASQLLQYHSKRNSL
jgi:hypothetical protein